jgi:hypothetical protein
MKSFSSPIDSSAVQFNLAKESDKHLETECKRWAEKERGCTSMLIAYIAEIGRRKLHVVQGYSSMFDYCQRVLGLSESESWLRIEIAKATAAYPELLEAFSAGQLSLTAAGKIARHLTPANKAGMFAACSGQSTRKVEDYLASLSSHKPVPRTTLRRLGPCSPAAAVAPRESPPRTENATVPVKEQNIQQDLFAASAHVEIQKSRECFSLTIALNEADLASLKRLAEVLGVAPGINQFPDLINRAVAFMLKAKDPSHPAKKKTLRKAKSGNKKRTRFIPASTKQLVFNRAGNRCEYTSPGGKRCSATSFLQIDHRFPFSRGSSNAASNLQTFCGEHNRFKSDSM